MEKLNEEFDGLFPNFKTLLKQATDKPYQFLYLDLKKLGHLLDSMILCMRRSQNY